MFDSPVVERLWRPFQYAQLKFVLHHSTVIISIEYHFQNAPRGSVSPISWAAHVAYMGITKRSARISLTHILGGACRLYGNHKTSRPVHLYILFQPRSLRIVCAHISNPCSASLMFMIRHDHRDPQFYLNLIACIEYYFQFDPLGSHYPSQPPHSTFPTSNLDPTVPIPRPAKLPIQTWPPLFQTCLPLQFQPNLHHSPAQT